MSESPLRAVPRPRLPPLRQRDLGIAHEIGKEVALLLGGEGLEESFRHERDGHDLARLDVLSVDHTFLTDRAQGERTFALRADDTAQKPLAIWP